MPRGTTTPEPAAPGSAATEPAATEPAATDSDATDSDATGSDATELQASAGVPGAAPSGPPPALWRRVVAEGLGTCLLVAVVVGSGIMATDLSDDAGLQLLENSLATTLGLAVLIAVLGPVSGAHFNPVVTLVFRALERRPVARGTSAPAAGGPTTAGALAYVAAQCAGGICGAVLANAMFGVPTTMSATDRATPEHLLSEVVATAGLVLVILGLLRAGREAWVPAAVGAYIGAAYWFTSSTSFANPAVTVGRAFSDTFAGIAPASVLPFVAAQLLGGAIAVALAAVLYPRPR